MLTESIIICLVVLCIWYTMQEGEIFGKLGDWFAHNLPSAVHPAVFECNVCMTPWYGSALYWTFPWQRVDLPNSSLLMWPVVILVAMGFNIVINKFEDKRKEEVEITGIKEDVAEKIREVMEERTKADEEVANAKKMFKDFNKGEENY